MTCYESNNMVGADKYPLWLGKQMEARQEGRRPRHVRRLPGAARASRQEDAHRVERVLAHHQRLLLALRARSSTGLLNKPGTFTITKKEKQFAEYEAPIKPGDVAKTGYQLFRSVNPQDKVYLAVKRSDLRDSESAFIVQTPYGGMILQGYTPYWDGERVDKKTGKKGMVVQRTDMKTFLRQCLDGTPPPVAHYDLKTHDELGKTRPAAARRRRADPWERHAGEAKRRDADLYKKQELMLAKRHQAGASLEHHPTTTAPTSCWPRWASAATTRPSRTGCPTTPAWSATRASWFGTPYMPNAEENTTPGCCTRSRRGGGW